MSKIQHLPVIDLDNVNHRRRQREVTNSILKFEHDDSRVQTAAEKLAGVTPVNYSYAPGDVRRYGAVLDGTTDDRLAIQATYDQFASGGATPILPAGTCYVSQNASTGYAILCASHVVLDGKRAFTLKGDGTNNYTLIYAHGGTNITIDIYGIKFNNNKVSPDRPSDNADIGFRCDSSIDTINIENCDFSNYNEDGILINSAVTGMGGEIKCNRFNNGCRSAVTITKGQYLAIHNNRAANIQLLPFSVQPANNTTQARFIDIDENYIIGGGNDSHDTGDRAAIFLSGKTGASLSDQQSLNARGNKIIGFGSTYAGSSVPLILGIETREIKDTLVSENFITGMTYAGAGLYSYLTDRATYKDNTSVANYKGLWMNACTNYTETNNTCRDSSNMDNDYHGPDGATSFVESDGQTRVLAKGSVSFSAGAPSLNSNFNISSVTDIGVGDTKFSFNYASNNGNYSVIASFRSFSGTTGLIESFSHSSSDFRILTLNAGAASDESYDFIVIGYAASNTEP